MFKFDPAAYGPVFEPLVAGDRCRAPVGGQPNGAAREALEKLTLESAFAHARIVNLDMGRCCLAGLWLVQDFRDQSHVVSQSIETSSGSYWHALVHRREGDYPYTKYWFRRIGEHPVFEPLAESVTALVHESGEPIPKFLAGGQWEPLAFVDALQQAVQNGTGIGLCCAVQQAEWELLFDHCYRAAR